MVKIISFPLTYCLSFLIWSLSSDVHAIGSSISAAADIKNTPSLTHHRTKRTLTYLVPLDDADSSEEHHKSKRCWKARPVQKVKLSRYPEEIKRPGNLNVLYEDEKRSAEDSWYSNEMSDENIGKLKLVALKNPRGFLDLRNTGVRDEAYSNESEDDNDDLILSRIKNHLNSNDYKVLALVGKRAGNYPANNNRKMICYCKEAKCSGADCDRMMYRPCSICRYPGPGFSGRTNTKYYENNGRSDYKNQETQGAKKQLFRYPENNDYLRSKMSQKVNEVDFRNPEKNQFLHETPRVVLNSPNNDRILQIPKSPMENRISGAIYPPAPGRLTANQYRPETVRLSPDPRWPMYPYYPSIRNSGVQIVPCHNQGIVRLQSNQVLGAPQPKTITGSRGTSNNEFYGGYQRGNGFEWTKPRDMRPQAHPELQSNRVPIGKIDYQRTTQTSVTSTSLEDKEDYHTSTEYSPGFTVALDRNSYEVYSDDTMQNGPKKDRGNLEDIEEQKNVDHTEVSDEPRKYKFPVVFTENVNSEERNELPEIFEGRFTPRPQEFVGLEKTTDHEDRRQSNWDQNIVGTTTLRITQSESNEDSGSDNAKTTTDSEGAKLVGAEEKYGRQSTSGDHSNIQVITNGYFSAEVYDDFGKDNGPSTETQGNTDHIRTNEEESTSGETIETQMESGVRNENVAMTPNLTNIGDNIEDETISLSGIDEASIKPESDDLRNIVSTQISVTSSQEDLSSSGDDGIVSKIRENGVSTHDDTTILNHNSNKDSENVDRNSESIGSGETRPSNPGSRRIPSDEMIESSENQESSSIERVGDQHADSEEYDSFTPEEKDVYTTYEEDDDILPSHSVNVDDVSQRILGKHIDHAPNIDKILTTHPATKNNRVTPDEYLTLVNGEPGDIGIDNLVTKYFSPNDRVLEYIKNHSQNLLREPGDNSYHRNTETPGIYDIETTTLQHYPGSESSSSSESDEILEQPFDGDESQDSLANSLDDILSHELQSQEEDTVIRGPEYGEEGNMRSAGSLERESTVLEKPRDDNYTGISGGSQKTVEGNIKESKDYGDSNYGYHSQYSPKVDLNNYGEEFHYADEDRSSEELLTSGREENETKNNLGNPMLPGSGRPAEIATENGRDQPEEHTSIEGLVKIKHLSNFSDETTETSLEYETTETSLEYETVEDSVESTSRSFEDNEESGTMGTNAQESIAQHNYYDSTEGTRGSVVLGNPQGLNDGRRDEKLGIIHIKKRPLEDTEESSTDYSTEKSYTDGYGRHDEEDNEESVIGRTTSFSQKVKNDRQSTTEIYSSDSISEEDVDRTNVKEGISGEENTLSEIQSHTEYSRANDVPNQVDTTKNQASSNLSDNNGSWSNEDVGNHNLPVDNNAHDISSTSLHVKPEVMKKLTKKEEVEEMKSVEFVGGSHSTDECYTRPPEVGDDIGYLGRLAPRNPNTDIRSLGDLVNSDLYYIGDGVRLPLAIKKLKDGSFALSISDKICKQRSKEICPCCVPREGKILQEKHGENDPEEAQSSLHRRAIPEEKERKELDNIEKSQHHGKRSARSITMPVDEFAEKYNLILDLKDRDLDDHESSLMHNVIQRDEEGQIDKDNGDLAQRLKSMKDLPENERAGVLLSTLKELIGTEQMEVFDKKLGLKSRGESEDDDGGMKFRYGYQRDNPILDRIETIKKLQKKMYKCEHKYQKDCDDAITQKTELLTMILYWLQDLASSVPN